MLSHIAASKFEGSHPRLAPHFREISNPSQISNPACRQPYLKFQIGCDRVREMMHSILDDPLQRS